MNLSNPPEPTPHKDDSLRQEIENIIIDTSLHPVDASLRIQALIATAVKEARIEEVNGFDTYRHHGKDYQDSMDELAEYKEKRIAALQANKEKP